MSSPVAWGRNVVRELRAQRRHVLGDGGRGSILTASTFSYSSTIGVPAANCCCIILGTWYVVGVVSVSYEKKRNACFYIEPCVRFYTRTRKFKNDFTNRRGKKGPFLNVKKYSIRNGLTVEIYGNHIPHGRMARRKSSTETAAVEKYGANR